VKISIITINRNNYKGLKNTIESVNYQSYSDFEFIIIDGASVDDSVKVIKSFADKITYWISEPDTGVYSAMNKGIMKAVGEYCLFLNSGDCIDDKETLKNIFDLDPHEDIFYGNIKLNGTIYKYPQELTLYNLRWGVLPHQASFIKRSLFNKYGLYSEQYKIASDWEFFLKTIVIHNCTYRYIDLLITVQEPLGLSSKLDCIEGMEILLSLFPVRIIKDYDKFKELDFYSNNEIFMFLERNKIIYKIIILIQKLSNLFNRKKSIQIKENLLYKEKPRFE
jgi:glycosyltransferase involved in cell wall biosynthesis